MNILINGPQGSGKTTQAKLIADKFNLNFIDSGSVLRESISTQEGKEVKEYIDKGELVPNELYFKVIENYVKNNCDNAKGFILSGIPRTLDQIPFVENKLAIKIDKVINLVVSQKEFLSRIKKRVVLEGRSDESDEALLKRLSWYEEKVKPVLDYYRDKIEVVDINGEKDIEVIFTEISSHLI